MICYNCGNDITTQGTNCPFCGSPLSADAGNRPNYNQAQYDNMQQQYNQSQPMDPKSSAIICYITLIGFIIACICADKNHPFVKSHLNNAAAINGEVRELPIIGSIKVFN